MNSIYISSRQQTLTTAIRLLVLLHSAFFFCFHNGNAACFFSFPTINTCIFWFYFRSFSLLFPFFSALTALIENLYFFCFEFSSVSFFSLSLLRSFSFPLHFHVYIESSQRWEWEWVCFYFCFLLKKLWLPASCATDNLNLKRE